MKLRDRRWRDKLERVVIDGWREVDYAARHGLEIEELFVSATAPRTVQQQALLDRLAAQGSTILELSAAIQEKVAFGSRHDALVAVARATTGRLDQLQLPDNPLIAVVERIEKPGNLGAILRSADAAGIHAIIAADAGTDLFNPNVIRTSMGTVFTVPTAVASAIETSRWLEAAGCQVVVARADADMDYRQADFTVPTALVLGSESHGVSEVWHDASHLSVRLPMRGVADSLNVSVAAAVLFYEALRQRDAAEHTK